GSDGSGVAGAESDTGGGAAAATRTSASGGVLIGERSGSTAPPALPELPDDTIAAWERLTLAGGTANLAYDTVRKRPSFDADLETNPDNDLRDSRLAVDLQVAIGGGYGRLLDVGGAIRVRRLSRALDDARALGRPIDAATAKKLQLTWWALRGERSTYRALVA